MKVHVRQERRLGLARVHAPHVRAGQDPPAVLIGGVREVVVSTRVRAERRVVPLGRQRATSFAASSSRSSSAVRPLTCRLPCHRARAVAPVCTPVGSRDAWRRTPAPGQEPVSPRQLGLGPTRRGRHGCHCGRSAPRRSARPRAFDQDDGAAAARIGRSHRSNAIRQRREVDRPPSPLRSAERSRRA